MSELSKHLGKGFLVLVLASIAAFLLDDCTITKPLFTQWLDRTAEKNMILFVAIAIMVMAYFIYCLFAVRKYKKVLSFCKKLEAAIEELEKLIFRYESGRLSSAASGNHLEKISPEQYLLFKKSLEAWKNSYFEMYNQRLVLGVFHYQIPYVFEIFEAIESIKCSADSNPSICSLLQTINNIE